MSDCTRWERGNAGAAVIFVHGLFGHPTKTWGRLPELVLQDARLSHCDVVTWGYHSPVFNLWDWLPFLGRRTPSVEEVASSLLTYLQNESALPPTHQLVLVGHSMGGLVILQALLAAAAGPPEKQAVLERIRSVVLYASPVEGVAPSAIFEVHRQAKRLAASSDLIESTCRSWQATFRGSAQPEGEKRYLPVTAIVGREDNAVPEKSARAFWSDVEVADGSHTEVCKPKDLLDTRYVVLRRQIEKHVLGTLHRGSPAILAAHEQLLRSAREELFCIGSRSRDTGYMERVEALLKARPELVYRRVLMGPPRNRALVEHLARILEMRSPDARPGGQRTVYVGLFNALDKQAEINLVGTESACTVILPPIDGVASYSAAMTFHELELVEAYRQLAASLHSHEGTRDLRTPADVRALL